MFHFFWCKLDSFRVAWYSEEAKHVPFITIAFIFGYSDVPSHYLILLHTYPLLLLTMLEIVQDRRECAQVHLKINALHWTPVPSTKDTLWSTKTDLKPVGKKGKQQQIVSLCLTVGSNKLHLDQLYSFTTTSSLSSNCTYFYFVDWKLLLYY